MVVVMMMMMTTVVVKMMMIVNCEEYDADNEHHHVVIINHDPPHHQQHQHRSKHVTIIINNSSIVGSVGSVNDAINTNINIIGRRCRHPHKAPSFKSLTHRHQHLNPVPGTPNHMRDPLSCRALQRRPRCRG